LNNTSFLYSSSNRKPPNWSCWRDPGSSGAAAQQAVDGNRVLEWMVFFDLKKSIIMLN